MRPILFEIPGLEWQLQAYGIAMGLALLAAWFIALRAARREGLPSESLGMLFVFAAFAGIVGARGLWLLQHPNVSGSLFNLPAGGLSIAGGVFAALLVTVIGCARRGVSTAAWLDAVAPGFAVGMAIEGVGAFLAGSEFGRYVAPGDFGYAFAVRFPAGSPVHDYHEHLMSGLPTFTPELSAPVHPVQLYATVMGVLIFAIAVVVRRRRSYPGQVAIAVLAGFVVARLAVEDPLRYDASAEIAKMVHMSHISALGLLLVLALTAGVLRRRAQAPS